MYTILLCDDHPQFLADLQGRVMQLTKDAGICVRICISTQMDTLTEHVLKSCDIAILDIDFENTRYNGMDIARKIRQYRDDAVIIFATNYIEYAPEGYEVRAFRYILKSEISEKLPRYLDEAIQYFSASRETIQFQVSGEIVNIPLSQILYIEAQLHTVNVYVVSKSRKKTVYSFYSSIGKLAENLESKGFLMVHKSYLVNMRHIRRYQCREVELDNGLRLNASASRYAEQKERYLLWKGSAFNV